jgi:hypothetical protein
VRAPGVRDPARMYTKKQVTATITKILNEGKMDKVQQMATIKTKEAV